MKDIAKDQEKPKIEKAVRETLGHRLYGGVYNSTYGTQIQVKLILDETRLQEKSNHVNYKTIGLKIN